MADSEEIWIKAGYETFALMGKEGLKVEKLAQRVRISKSSFYHRFADLEVFEEHLFKYHLQQCVIIAEKEKAAKCIQPELINILVEHKTDLLFNRQLRFNQQNKKYKEVLTRSNMVIGNEFIIIWQKDLQLNLTPLQLQGIFELALENFFLKINAENLTTEWLAVYFNDLKRIARSLA